MRWIVPRTFDQLFVGGDWHAPVLVMAEMGTPKWFAELAHGVGPHLLASSTLDFAARYAWEAGRGGSLLRREPVGVVGAITPWNVPQVTIMSKLMPALVVGCTVIVKPAPETPLDAMLLATLLAEADLPPGVAAVELKSIYGV